MEGLTDQPKDQQRGLLSCTHATKKPDKHAWWYFQLRARNSISCVYWSVGLLVRWSVGQLVHWSVGLSVADCLEHATYSDWPCFDRNRALILFLTSGK